jgi:hypothetical protein
MFAQKFCTQESFPYMFAQKFCTQESFPYREAITTWKDWKVQIGVAS